MSKIGRFEVEAELGRGAMGVVYLARDPRLQRQVAIKTYCLPAGLTAEQKKEFQERFLREAQAAACLSHPGIVTIFDSAESDEHGDPFIAMEYVPGRSLREWLDAEGRLEPGRAVEIVATLASALHVAHRAGIVHRDLKPGNLLVHESGKEVKIADFGVARLAASDLTGTGVLLGSPAYMSPEQIQGKAVDGRSDLFSLAVILYEALCGARPFQGEDLARLAYGIVHETPIPATKSSPGLPAAVDGFFDRALAKEPANRFPDGDSFRTALEEAIAARDEPSHEATVRNSPWTEEPVEGRGELSQSVAAAHVDEEDSMPPTPALLGDDTWDGTEPRSHGKLRPLLLAIVVLVVILGVRWLVGGDAYVDLHAKSSIPSGTLTVSVDGREAFSRELAAKGSKSVRVLKKAVGIGHENFNASFELGAGRHEIVARLYSDEDDSEYTQRLTVELDRGERRDVKLTAGSAYGSPLSLKLD